MRGRLVGPETRDRSAGNLGLFWAVLRLITDCYWYMCYNLCNKLWFWCCWAENGHGFRFHKVEPMLGERAAHGQPTAQFGTVKNSPGLHGWTKKMSMCYLHKIA